MAAVVFYLYLYYYSLLISRLIFANAMDFLENMLRFIKYKNYICNRLTNDIKPF